jgi:putative ABC transport system substrate-binding protein
VRRRELIAFACGVAALWPHAARTQQSVPVIGFLHQGPPEPIPLMTAFGRGLSEIGISEGRDVTIENRWADGQYERLPGLAGDLVNRHVAVIAANFLPAALAAKAATQTVPIVFLSGSDPIASGLVPSFARPGGNVTGIAFMFTRLGPKNLELLHELLPQTARVGVLMNPSNPNAAPQVSDLQVAAGTLGLQLDVLGAATVSEIDEAFAQLAQRQIRALVVTADGFLIGRQDQLVALAARHAVPTIYPLSQYVAAGGLMSYGASLSDAYRQTGNYVGRIIKGATPAELPVMQSAKFELVVSLKAAKALGLTVPPTLLAGADEVIE